MCIRDRPRPVQFWRVGWLGGAARVQVAPVLRRSRCRGSSAGMVPGLARPCGRRERFHRATKAHAGNAPRSGRPGAGRRGVE
eukprot:5515560-Alexandrium_andersonii.AAC.1